MGTDVEDGDSYISLPDNAQNAPNPDALQSQPYYLFVFVNPAVSISITALILFILFLIYFLFFNLYFL